MQSEHKDWAVFQFLESPEFKLGPLSVGWAEVSIGVVIVVANVSVVALLISAVELLATSSVVISVVDSLTAVASLVGPAVVFGLLVEPATVKLIVGIMLSVELFPGVVTFVVRGSCVLVGLVVDVCFIAVRVMNG